MSGCAGCDDPKTVGQTIVNATGYICNGLVGIASLYEVAASNAVGEDKKLFKKRARQMSRLARVLANSVVVPDDTPKLETEQ